MDPSIKFPSYQKHLLFKTKQQQEEEEKVYAKYAKIVATLPTTTMCGLTFHQYQGFWFGEQYTEAVMSAQDHFQAQPTDILLASCPKSGTTWLKALIFTIVYRRTYASTTAQHPLHEYNPHDLVLSLEDQLHGHNRNCEFDAQFPQPRIFGTHMPYTSLPQSIIISGCKIVYVSRNPRDNLVSAWHFIRNWAPELTIEECFEGYVKGHSICGPYWDHVLGYWRVAAEKPETLLFLKYEQMMEDPGAHVKRLALFLGCPFSEDEGKNRVVEDIVNLCSFKSLTGFEVNKTGTMHGKSYSSFFRKGEVGDSNNYLTEGMIEELDEITEQKFKYSGLTF